VLLAKGRSQTFFWTELASNLVHLGFVWLGLRWFGLSGVGMAYFGLYVFYGLMILTVVHRLSGFRWTPENLRLGVGALGVVAMVFLVTGYWLTSVWGMVLGGVATLAFSLYALRRLEAHLGRPIFAVVIGRLRSLKPI
jgi:PST family polysaccharide transporter